MYLLKNYVKNAEIHISNISIIIHVLWMHWTGVTERVPATMGTVMQQAEKRSSKRNIFSEGLL